MFGYVNINKMELKFREYYRYKGYYCGLCMSLKKNYGNLSRLTLNYDITFLVLLLSSLYEVSETAHKSRCIAHPTSKQIIIENDIIDYAAAMNILLSYYNLVDDWEDEKSVLSKAFSILIKGDVKKASRNYDEKLLVIKSQLQKINELEQNKCDDVDIISNEFGKLMEELILYKYDHFETRLRKIGMQLGKYIYILDAYLDYQEDLKKKSYNPFIIAGFDFDEKLHKYVDDKLSNILGEFATEIDKLPLIRDKNIIDNIIYSGILIKYNKYREEMNIKGNLNW